MGGWSVGEVRVRVMGEWSVGEVCGRAIGERFVGEWSVGEWWDSGPSVSYTHLTLPTSDGV